MVGSTEIRLESSLVHPLQRADESINLRHGPYRLRLATTEPEILAALRLRFLVFNLELGEGLESAYATGYDTDPFDSVCDHLIVEHLASGQIVGTYRLQTGKMAVGNLGFYTEREFDFAPYRGLNASLVELGRACVHRDHRSSDVLSLLWQGIAQYAMRNEARYLIGCSSLTSQDPAHGTAAYEKLQDYLVDTHLTTTPKPSFAMPLVRSENVSPKVPKLLRTYLAIGAKICGPPAIDREFKTIDLLTFLDLETLHPRIRARFFKA